MPMPNELLPRQEEREDETRFTNFYVHCQVEWKDEWSCACNDRCPECNSEIEPYASREKGAREPALFVDAEWIPEQGLPEGMENVEKLAGWPESAGSRMQS
jgi:hypothetical protein